ncbi:MAG: hypothetical protein IK099_04380 [Clostridia bacterium]|nr:hypothetical protein [Clostridia bacterium]
MSKKRIWVAVAAVFTAILETALIGGLVYNIREMNHEALTYSQWYEGSIYGVYSSLLVVIAVTGLLLAAWVALFRSFRKKSGRKTRVGKRLPGILFAVFTLLTAAFILLSAVRHGEIGRAEEEKVECLAPYIKAFGNCLVFSLLSFEAAAASLIALLKRNKAAEKGNSTSA